MVSIMREKADAFDDMTVKADDVCAGQVWVRSGEQVYFVLRVNGDGSAFCHVMDYEEGPSFMDRDIGDLLDACLCILAPG